MARYSLIATDLDGTLLRGDGSVSVRTRAAINAAQESGIRVAFVTARPPRDIRVLADDVGLTGIAVCSNGAILYDIVAREVLYHRQLGADLCRCLIAELRDAIPDITFGIEHGHKFGQEPAFPNLFEATVHDHAPRVDCALLLCEDEPTKLIAHHPRRTAEELVELAQVVVGSRAGITHSGWPIIEVGPVGVSKASGLKSLCDRLGISASRVIAFGDMPNDVPMLAFAGRSVGVANAHPEVIAIVNQVTLSNDEDGVAVVIESLLE